MGAADRPASGDRGRAAGVACGRQAAARSGLRCPPCRRSPRATARGPITEPRICVRAFPSRCGCGCDSLDAGQVLLDNRTPDGKGFCLQTAAGGAVEIVLNDGRSESRWACDPGLLQAGKKHHVVAIIDGGPKIITLVVDGRLCDGGDVAAVRLGPLQSAIPRPERRRDAADRPRHPGRNRVATDLPPRPAHLRSDRELHP